MLMGNIIHKNILHKFLNINYFIKMLLLNLYDILYKLRINTLHIKYNTI